MTATISPTNQPIQVNQTPTTPPSSPVKFSGRNSKDLEKDTLEIKNKAQNPAIDDDDDEEDMEYKEAGTGKKFGVATGSFFIPGLGQAINGQWLKGLGFFASWSGLYATACWFATKKKNPKIAKYLFYTCIANNIISAVDAWRNAKTKV